MIYRNFALIIFITLGFSAGAKDLREGDVFVGANGELSTLVNLERVQFDETIKVYNFTVDGNHNYFVIAKTGDYGQTCILVHNAKKNYGKPVHSAGDFKKLNSKALNGVSEHDFKKEFLGKKQMSQYIILNSIKTQKKSS